VPSHSDYRDVARGVQRSEAGGNLAPLPFVRLQSDDERRQLATFYNGSRESTDTHSSLLKRASVLVRMPVLWPEPDRRRLAATSCRDNQEEPS
jgi:hypothetical protein